MAPKKQMSKKKQTGPTPPETKEDFENELKTLAGQAQNETWGQWGKQQVAVYGRAVALIILTAVYANVSVMTLSPVYGQIAANRLHHYVVWTGLFVGWAGNLALRRALPFKTISLLPLIALQIPMSQFYLFAFSGALGVEYGPAITELLTLFPLVVVSAACIADILDGADLSGLPSAVANPAPGIVSYIVFRYSETSSLKQLVEQMGTSLMQTRMALEFVLAATYSIMGRSQLLRYAVPGILHAAVYNTHLMTESATTSLNTTLNANGWSLVDRWESNTGYISVLDSHVNGYRLMRCDQSLLGGEWTKFGRNIVAEPVYSVFTQLEAVRLVEVPEKVPDNEARALNIGLGIGTTPSALIAHGIDTTIVEIDPVVHKFASKYFGLPPNHTAVIEDVVSWSHANAPTLREHFDYIVHDVFTGGAEPVDLFTDTFLGGLKYMLKPNGVIVINYAGDFTLPPLSIVVNTIKDTFPSCRVFRENEPPSEDKLEETGHDFDNVMIFCVKTDNKITFRDPIESDYLESISRRQTLVPKHEVPLSAISTREEVGILRANETGKITEWHEQSALRHWDVMRTVLPNEIWNQW
ncbi:S-adenosyl-L-methionine-dependent methyltransferase [Xylaria bambusicola]|uniref:S-adenosyl-L-methionine-dependent methyltransferase n=1 Tax=Xylaria bambusicola TaxID=326684 RepID=UPI0020085D26|nr:S-adenosyl-L-methionine-dependent methyltransferase [Xylaria bambusicola]KAI0506076.1 S-adenosyl-L-methionine-dependent methyltransferase [Xylaria bambusicola]